MKENSRKTAFYILLGVMITGFLLLFSFTTSPLYPNTYGVDSAFNRFMGLMIRRGKVLYSEIWDNKGPVLFFIQAIGTLKGTRNAGLTLTFLMQAVSFFLTVFILFKTDETVHRGGKRYPRLILIFLAAAAILAKVMESGNLSEEWSLPMIGCSLYMLINYAGNAENDPRHPCRYAFIHGICFALIAFIRVNNAISQCAGLLLIAVYLMIRKQWKNLLENILFGLLGIAVITLPVMIYFLSKHALGDMLYAVFFYNLKYAERRTHKTFAGTDLLDRFLPIAASLLILLIHLIRKRRIRLTDIMMLMIIAANGIMLWQSNVYLHYYVIFVPVWLMVLLLYADLPGFPEILAALAVCAYFIRQDARLVSGIPEMMKEPDKYAYAATIPEDEKDSAIAIWVSPEVYLNSGLIPCSRYAAYQFMHFPVDPPMLDEFLNDLHSKNPKWIAILSGYEEIYPEVGEMLSADYQKMHDEFGVTYYRMR